METTEEMRERMLRLCDLTGVSHPKRELSRDEMNQFMAAMREKMFARGVESNRVKREKKSNGKAEVASGMR
jgi:hypothetical protein